MASWNGTIPVYINNFQHYRTTRGLVEYFNSICGVEPVVVDNNSDYEPLLDWYATKPCKVIRLAANFGHLAPWMHGCIFHNHVHRVFWGSSFYGLTDSDLVMDDVPKDVFDVMIEGLALYPNRRKCGVSLDTEGIPDGFPHKDEVVSWEKQWSVDHMSDPRFLNAGVDTTMALYRSGMMHADSIPSDRSLRIVSPYTAKHDPWHWTRETIGDEERHFLKSIRKDGTTMWSRELADLLLIPDQTNGGSTDANDY